MEIYKIYYCAVIFRSVCVIIIIIYFQSKRTWVRFMTGNNKID